MRRPSNLLIVAAFAVAIACHAEEHSPADRLDAHLLAVQSLQADFEQITSTANRSGTTSGRVYLAKPLSFRVETRAPQSQVLVSDGDSFWNYDVDLEQVIVSQASSDINQVPIMLFAQTEVDIGASYNVSGYTDEARETFLLEPLLDTSLFRVLVLEFEDGVPVEIRVDGSNGQVSRFLLSDVSLNGEIEREQFSFVAPEGVDVIDDRSPVQ